MTSDADDEHPQWLRDEMPSYPTMPPEAAVSVRTNRMPDRIGEYQILGGLGEGGSGEVFRAREPRSGRDVALKRLKVCHVDRPEMVRRFRESIQITAHLEHRSIVRVYDTSGLQENLPYYTMQLVSGGTLGRPKHHRRPRSPREAADLMIKIADAVHFAHEANILHRDLKPSNILLDFDDEPYVTDFNAKRADDPQPDAHGGTVPYMAPEQVRGEPEKNYTDVYGLGAVFYELLTRRPPLEVVLLSEARKVDRAKERVRWEQALSRVDAGLSDVCLAALGETPSARPPTAHVLGEELKRALVHQPPLFLPTSRLRRIRLWTKRHPLLALSAAIGVVLLVIADVAMFVVARLERAEMGRDVLRTNSALASAQARGMLAGLKRYSDYTLQAAANPGVAEVLTRAPSGELMPVLRDIYERAGVLGPSAVVVIDRAGVLVSRFPPPVQDIGRNYAFRDYYECTRAMAERNGRAVCITPAYRTEADDSMQFAFSSPVYDSAGKWVGALALSRSTARTLGEIDFNDRYRSSQLTAVIGGRGPDRHRRANREEMIVVVHPDLHGNGEFALDASLAKRLMKAFSPRTLGGYVDHNDSLPLEHDDYVDPVSVPPERMLASFAPVGQTGYVVAVATPYRNAQRPNQRLLSLAFTYGSVLNLCFLAIAGVAVWASSRAPRTAEGSGSS